MGYVHACFAIDMLRIASLGAQQRMLTSFIRTPRLSCSFSACFYKTASTARTGKRPLLHVPDPLPCSLARLPSSRALTQGDGGQKLAPVSRKERWKHAIKEYGSAMVAFHVVLSISSFGLCYGLVSSGIDMVAIAETLGFNVDSQWVNSKLASGSGTVVLAYAVHKLFTPLRMGITLTTAPILVRWLRRNGIFGFRY